MPRRGMVGLLAVVFAAAAADPLANERWRHRVLLVFADAPEDLALLGQRQVLASAADGLQKRDVRVIEILGDSASEGLDGAALRAAFARGRGFAVVLVGKDGGAKRRSTRPLAAASLFETIDSMPMARDEAARRAKP